MTDRPLWRRGPITLVWPEGHELHGVEIVMRRRTLGEIAESYKDDEIDRKPAGERTAAESRAIIERNAADLASVIIEWNLADDNDEIAAITPHSVLRLIDPVMSRSVWDAYNEASSRVAAPLAQRSADGPSEWDLPPIEPMSPETVG